MKNVKMRLSRPGPRLVDLKKLGYDACFKQALIRAILKHRLAYRRMRTKGIDGLWIETPDQLLERILREAQACMNDQAEESGKGKGDGKGKPPPVLNVVTLA
jgi:hypothetical protein